MEENVFAPIVGTYDFLNSFLSFSQDRRWRRLAISLLEPKPGMMILDMGMGTGKIALEIARRNQATTVIGIDPCCQMLQRARNGTSEDVHFIMAQAEDIPFPDAVFDGVITGFTLRNVTNLERALSELTRVVKPGGKVVCLEFVPPSAQGVQRLPYRFYLSFILPFIGGLISRQRNAYTYLSESIIKFLTPDEVKQLMEHSGLCNVRVHRFTMGIVAIYMGVSP